MYSYKNIVNVVLVIINVYLNDKFVYEKKLSNYKMKTKIYFLKNVKSYPVFFTQKKNYMKFT